MVTHVAPDSRHVINQKQTKRMRYDIASCGTPTDLHIYNLDAVPPIHIISNNVDTDKLTTANGGTFT